MSNEFETELEAIRGLLTKNLQSRADEAFRDLLSRLKREQVVVRETDFRGLLASFWPKRAKELQVVLDAKLASPPTPSVIEARLAEERRFGTTFRVEAIVTEYARRLDRLRDAHIFRWTTNYREEVVHLFGLVREALGRNVDREPIATAVLREVARHSTEIYQKGFDYVTRRLGMTEGDALAKSVSGLSSFLALPIRVYSDHIYGLAHTRDASAIRLVCSSILSGILLGYSEATLGSTVGATQMSRYPRIWAHALAFLTAEHAKSVLNRVGRVDQLMQNDLGTAVVPVLGAVDRLLGYGDRREYLLPLVSEYSIHPRKLTVSLQLPSWTRGKRFVDIECYMASGELNADILVDALDRRVELIAAPFSDELAVWREEQGLRAIRLLDTTPSVGDPAVAEANAADRAFAILQDALSVSTEEVGATALIPNYALDFPLESPSKVQFFLVHRASVARLLRRFEGETGVHLWCSVRRSGKTTACRDLGSFSGKVLVVTQTMSQDTAQPELNIFYDAVVKAIDDRRALGRTFLEDIVRKAAASRGGLVAEASKVIFVLDEYEQLFGRLRGAVKEDEHLQYSVAHPLLDQIASFGRDNLVVFLGQEPDAHFILMDHNQLSPLVKQDHFPLFAHAGGGEDSEFSQFLRRVVSEHVSFEPGLAGAIFEETGGHPYLTVNMMVEMFDWLQERRRRANELTLTRDDFAIFREERLAANALERSRSYSFMSNLVTQSLGSEIRNRNPWLHCVMIGLRKIGQQYPKTLMCSEPDFQSLIRGVSEPLKWPPAHLLRAAQMANFLSLEKGYVKPTIPLFSRIAAVARPAED